MDNTTEDNHTQNGTPEEGCCCDTAEQAPVTVEMIEEAFEYLNNMVNRCQTPVLAHILIEKGDRVDGKSTTCEAVVEMSGPKVRNGSRLAVISLLPEIVSPAIPKLSPKV